MAPENLTLKYVHFGRLNGPFSSVNSAALMGLFFWGSDCHLKFVIGFLKFNE